jgi:hypothetical protein
MYTAPLIRSIFPFFPTLIPCVRTDKLQYPADQKFTKFTRRSWSQLSTRVYCLPQPNGGLMTGVQIWAGARTHHRPQRVPRSPVPRNKATENSWIHGSSPPRYNLTLHLLGLHSHLHLHSSVIPSQQQKHGRQVQKGVLPLRELFHCLHGEELLQLKTGPFSVNAVHFLRQRFMTVSSWHGSHTWNRHNKTVTKQNSTSDRPPW